MREELLMDKPLKKPRFAILAVSLLLLIVLVLAGFEMISLLRQGWSNWLSEWLRPLAVFAFTILALYLLNGRSQKAAEWLQRFRLPLLIPALQELIENQKRYEANRLVAERMDVTLDFYRLEVQDQPVAPPAETAPTGLWGRLHRLGAWLRRLWRRWRPVQERPRSSCQEQVVERMPLLVLKEGDRIDHCAEEVLKCGVVTGSGQSLTQDQLCLLYREQHGLETRPLFAGMRAVPQQMTALAHILSDSGRLPERRPGQPFSNPEVASKVQEMDDFELSGLQDKLLARQQQIASYQVVVDKIFYTVEYFGLEPPHDTYDALVDDAPQSDDLRVMLSCCAAAVGDEMKQPAAVLELLYRELYELETKAHYQQMESEISRLAQILLDSGRLPERRPGQLFSTDEVVDNLRHLQAFALEGLQDRLLARQREINVYQAVVDRMVDLLPYFKLASLAEVYDDLVDNAPRSTDRDEMIAHCAWDAGGHLSLGAELLELLYRERYSLSQPAAWKKLIPDLAEVLVGNPNLPSKELAQEEPAQGEPDQAQQQAFSKDEICRALSQLPDFSMEGLVKRLLANEVKRREGLAILRRMEYTLNYYRLFGRLKEYSRRPKEQSVEHHSPQPDGQNGYWLFTEDFRQDYFKRLPDHFDAEDYARRCATTVADHLKPEKVLPSPGDLVELVYWERNGEQTAAFWAERQQKLCPGLAQVLVDSGKLPDPALSFPYRADDLEEILAPHEDFSLNLIRDEVDHLGVLWRLAEKYRQFLQENEIETWHFQPADLLALVGPLPAEQSRLPKLLDKALDVLLSSGTRSIKGGFPAIKEEIVARNEQEDVERLLELDEVLAAIDGLEESFCRVSLAIFLSGEPDTHSRELLRQVCVTMNEDEYAAPISLAFVDLTADLEGRQQAEEKDFVTVRALIKNWRQRDAHLKENFKGYDKEIDTLNQVFRSGEWLTRLWKTLTETLHNLSDASAPVKDLVENRQQLIEALRRVFMRLDVRTIERFLEARTVVAYLIAFDSTKGSLAGLLDSFLLRPAEIAAERNDDRREKLWEQYRQLQELGIHLQDGQGRWLYNFRPYTFNTRIGVLPSGWTLEKFHKLLSADMKAVTEAPWKVKGILAPEYGWTKEDDLEATEVILHRFGLRNHYALNLASRSEKAVQNMKGLFATQIDFDDLVATISYEHLDLGTIADAINAGSIAELGHDAAMHDRERSKLERRDVALKLSLLQRLGLSGLPVSELEVLQVPLSEEEAGQIDRKLQQDVLARTLRRILQRHTSLKSKVRRRKSLASALLQDVQTALRTDQSLRLLQRPLEEWPAAEDPGYPWAEIAAVGDTLKLAILDETECLVLDPLAAPDDPEPERQLLEGGIKVLVQRMVGDAGQIDDAGETLVDAMVDLVPRINEGRCRTIAGNYLNTLRDVTLLRTDG